MKKRRKDLNTYFFNLWIMKSTIDLPEDKLPQLLLALVNHGFTILPSHQASTDEGLLDVTTERYTQMPLNVYCYPEATSISAFYNPRYQPRVGEPPRGRLEIRYDSNTDHNVLRHLYLALKDARLRKRPFKEP